MSKKGQIKLSSSDTGFRPGVRWQQPQYDGANPNMVGRDNEYAAEMALRSGQRAAQRILSSGDVLSRQIERTGAIIEQSIEERQHNMDVTANASLKAYLREVASGLEQSEGQLFGDAAAGAKDRVSGTYNNILERIQAGEREFEIGSRTIRFGTDDGLERAVESVRGELADRVGQYVSRETRELRQAAIEGVDVIAQEAIVEVQRFPGRADEFAQRLETEIRESLDTRFVSDRTIDLLVAKYETALYTAAADQAVTDLLADAHALARGGQDFSEVLDQARSLVESPREDGGYAGVADAGKLSDILLTIERTQTTLESRQEAERDRLMAQQRAGIEAGIRTQHLNLEQALDNILRVGGSFGVRDGQPIPAGPETIREIDRACDRAQQLYDQMYTFDLERGGQEFADQQRLYREKKLAQTAAMMYEATNSAEYRQQFISGTMPLSAF